MPQIILTALLGAVLIYLIYDTRQKSCLLDQKITNLAQCNDELQKTLIYGLSVRFLNHESEETPYDFKKLVADILQKTAGGNALVTLLNNDYGVDIEHRAQGELFLSQVRCLHPEHKLDYEPIAIIHSQIVKQKAAGGLVVTTSDFTDNAKEYARSLGIELINGQELVRLWLKAVEAEKEHSLSLTIKPTQP